MVSLDKMSVKEVLSALPPRVLFFLLIDAFAP